jgi:GNAT superfamily N-acetyltransferase
MPQHIRSALPRDEAAWRRMWSDFIQGGPEPCSADAPDAVWRGAMDASSPLRLLIAADDADQPIGFLLYVTHPWSWSARDVAYLLDIYVEPSSRGRGLGSRLIEHLAGFGRKEGWLKIYWMTQADNEAAHRLYEKLAVRSALVRYDLMLNPY